MAASSEPELFHGNFNIQVLSKKSTNDVYNIDLQNWQKQAQLIVKTVSPVPLAEKFRSFQGHLK